MSEQSEQSSRPVDATSTDTPLAGLRVVTVAVNVPGPVAAERFAQLGAHVTTVLPPIGDPLQQYCAAWYTELHAGQEMLTLDLKKPEDAARFDGLLAEADLLITSSRPSALRRLRIDFETLHARHPRLCQVDIVGDPGEGAEVPGHDLTYQATNALIRPPAMPATLIADLSGAERAVADGLAAIVARDRTGLGSRREVALAETAKAMGRPAVHGLTAPGGILGGGHPPYAIYAAADGHVALAALEPHFLTRTTQALGVDGSAEAFAGVFATRTAADWEAWAAEHDVPLAAVRAD